MSLASLTLVTLYLSFILPYSAHTPPMSPRSLRALSPPTGSNGQRGPRESLPFENLPMPETPRLVTESPTSGRCWRRSRSRRVLSRYFQTLWRRFKRERPSLRVALGRLGVTRAECQMALVCHVHTYLMDLPAGVGGLLVMIT